MTNQKTTEEVATKIRVDLKLEKLNKAKNAYDFAVKFFKEGDTSKQTEKKVALLIMKMRGQLKDLPDGSATFDKRVLKETIKETRRANPTDKKATKLSDILKTIIKIHLNYNRRTT